MSTFVRRIILVWILVGYGTLAADYGGEWRPLLITRFGDIDAIDAEDGSLATFLRSIRNDGRFPPPMRTLIGPLLRNPTFFGLSYEAWLECLLLAPARPGALAPVWVFPVDNRDEYLSQLTNQGLNEYDGMDGVTILREMDQDGKFQTWYMEWLPGNVALFGREREAVSAARRLYAENSASLGMLAGAEERFVQPDVHLRFEPGVLATWRDRDPGRYWWRSTVEMLAGDLVTFWNPRPARMRLINTLAEELAVWPRTQDTITLQVWFEETGIEWRLEGIDGRVVSTQPAELDSFRSLPERTAMGYAMPVTAGYWRALGDSIGRLLLDGAGGVVTAEASLAAGEVFATLSDAGLTEVTSAWVAPPAGQPEFGASRLIVGECRNPDALALVWRRAIAMLAPETPVSQALSQVGWRVEVKTDIPVSETAEIVLRSDIDGAQPYFDAAIAVRRQNGRVALVTGTGRLDSEARQQILEYRAELAREAAEGASPGIPAVRAAFTRAGPTGAPFLGILDPLRFLQLCLIEAADWRPRSPDQPEPLSTQLAREMLEYGSGGSWSAAGELADGELRLNGEIPWQSLARLAAALGVTESIGMD